MQVNKKLRKKLGQNTAEYLIMLVLIAGGSIGIFSIFGTTIRHHLGNVVSAFGGSGTKWTKTETIKANGEAAGTIGQKKVDMQGLEQADTVPDIQNAN